MKKIPTLETKRLRLRPFELSDAKDVQRLAGNWSVASMTANIPYPYEDGMAETWISGHEDLFSKEQCVYFAIILKRDNILVGAINLINIVKGHQAELGYWIGKPFWNQGFCTEACHAILHYAFTELSLLRVHACHASRNPASGRVMQKMGMHHEGTRRQHFKKRNICDDSELYVILKEQYRYQL